jgi:hypothetical protein
MTADLPRGGRLEQTSLPAALRPLVRQKKTGLLRLARGRAIKTVYLLEGRLIFATSNDPDDRLGEMLLRKGRIGYRALEESVAAIQKGKRQGTILVESGEIRSRDLVEGVTEQVQEIIYSLFEWEDGEWQFEEGDLPSREVIVLRMSTGDLVRQGIRRVDRWSRIRAGVGALGQRYALSAEAPALLGSLSLTPEEMNLVATLDGPTALDEILSSARGGDFGVCRAVWGLWAAGVLDRVPQDSGEGRAREGTEPHAERMAGASVGREIDRFNQLHRFLFELVSYDLRERATDLFERAFQGASAEHGALFDGVAVDASGELDPIALRHNVVTREVARYLQGLDRLLDLELGLARQMMGEKKAAIIADGLLALKQRHLEGS